MGLNLFSIPAGGKGLNPFITLMNESLRDRGHVVEGAGGRAFLFQRHHALIIHWPDHSSTQRGTLAAWARTFTLFALILWQKMLGAKVIRMVHDVSPLAPSRQLLLRINGALSRKLQDRYVFLSETSRAAFHEMFPAQKTKPSVVLFHPRYDDDIATFADRSDRQAGPLRIVGTVRPYKGLDRFIELLAHTGGIVSLEIIGGCFDKDHATDLMAAIAAANDAGCSITWQDRWPEDDEMRSLIATAGAVVLPYRRGWNSGMALSVLEQGTPLLCSDLAIFHELSDAVGPPWITTFVDDGSDLAAKITEALNARPDRTERAHLADWLSEASWPRYAEDFEAILRR